MICLLHGGSIGGDTLEYYGLGEGALRAFCVPPVEDAEWGTIYDRFLPANERKHLGKMLRHVKAHRAYVPFAPAMSARIVGQCELQEELIPLPGGTQLYRNLDCPSDGLLLEPGEAAVYAADECGIALAGPVVAHCGRDSLLDRATLMTGTPSREHLSVIHAMATRLERAGMVVEQQHLNLLFQLPAERFNHPLHHPVHGAFHRAMLRYAKRRDDRIAWEEDDNVWLDIGRLAVVQANRTGFGSADAKSQLPVGGAFGYTRHPDQSLRSRKNLVIVVRPA